MLNIRSHWKCTFELLTDSILLQSGCISSRKQMATKVDGDVEKEEALFTAGVGENLYTHYGKEYGGSLKH